MSPGLMSPEVPEMSTDQVRKDYQTKNRIIKECLADPQKGKHLNESMASTIKREVYGHSLARVLLAPKLVDKGHCPVFEETPDGPVVMINLVQQEKRVLSCRAFRDSLREEETVTSIRDIDFVVMRGQAIRPVSFPISNVCTLRLPDLNGDSFNRVERSRQRMLRSLATDETSIVIRALSWVCRRFGRKSWAPFSGGWSCRAAITDSINRIGKERNPVIVSSLSTMTEIAGLKPVEPPSDTESVSVFPMKAMAIDGRDYPVYHCDSIPDWAIFVIPSGESLGQMPIFIEPNILDYDKPERLIKGWLCYQDQGVVFVNVRLTNTVYVGLRGLLEMVKNFFRLWNS